MRVFLRVTAIAIAGLLTACESGTSDVSKPDAEGREVADSFVDALIAGEVEEARSMLFDDRHASSADAVSVLLLESSARVIAEPDVRDEVEPDRWLEVSGSDAPHLEYEIDLQDSTGLPDDAILRVYMTNDDGWKVGRFTYEVLK